MAYHAESVKLRTALPLTKTNLLSLQLLPVRGGGKGAAQAGWASWLTGAQGHSPAPLHVGHFCLKSTEQGQQDVSAGKMLIAKHDN